ncbi:MULTISPECIES: polymorphic toxin-type HINT domain-containing protein [Brevibacillus]|uniref:Uncharacterized protein n=1 Tax=Brevibacillus brevis TaxID=1393 RepID=A0A2Z4MC83_BREBE|nr:hypothetical protein AB432_002415 [Brevibacillus brevis]NRR21662.1 hypothetical protein [Brevibacillus sp. MS2.2]
MSHALPTHLESMYNMVKRAFPDGITEEEYYCLLFVMYESMSNNLMIDSIKVVQHDKKVKVYNFTVADFHTYFVSGWGVWVHNTACITITPERLAHAS